MQLILSAPQHKKHRLLISNLKKLKNLLQEYDFDYFDVDNDGKLSGTELTKLKSMFNSVDFDVDEDDAVDESAFNSALSEYKES